MVFIIMAFVLVFLFFYYRWHNIQADKREVARMSRIKSLPNYRRLVSLNDNGREYFARVLVWDARENEAELWCVMGPNPDGYTGSFFWDRSQLEFID